MLMHELQIRMRNKATMDHWSPWFQLETSMTADGAQTLLDLARVYETKAGCKIVVESGSGFRAEDPEDGTWYEYRLFLWEPDHIATETRHRKPPERT